MMECWLSLPKGQLTIDCATIFHSFSSNFQLQPDLYSFAPLPQKTDLKQLVITNVSFITTQLLTLIWWMTRCPFVSPHLCTPLSCYYRLMQRLPFSPHGQRQSHLLFHFHSCCCFHSLTVSFNSFHYVHLHHYPQPFINSHLLLLHSRPQNHHHLPPHTHWWSCSCSCSFVQCLNAMSDPQRPIMICLFIV